MYQRKDGRFEQKIYIGKDKNNQAKYKTVLGATQKEVREKAAELKVKLNKGVAVTTANEKTFDYWCDLFFNNKGAKMTEEHLKTEKSRAEYFRTRLGNKDIAKITTAEVEQLFVELEQCNPHTSKPSANKTLIEYRSIICRIFDYAVQNRVLTFNPITYITFDKSPKKAKRTALTDTQIKTIRETPYPQMQTIAMVMIYSGLRIGEAFALQWTDIDFDEKTITINKSLNTKTNQIKAPKTEAGNRTVPLLSHLEQYLATVQRDSFFVCSDDGAMFTRGKFEKRWAHYNDALGFSFLPHECRHTFITLLYEAGVDELTTANIVGHSDISTTREIYTHLREKKRCSAIQKINDYVSNL